MNLMSILAGEIIGGASQALINKMGQGQPKLKFLQGNFGGVLEGIDNSKQQLKLEDLDIDEDQKAEILEIRGLAMEKGLKSVEVAINNQIYQLNTRDLSLVPVV